MSRPADHDPLAELLDAPLDEKPSPRPLPSLKASMTGKRNPDYKRIWIATRFQRSWKAKP